MDEENKTNTGEEDTAKDNDNGADAKVPKVTQDAREAAKDLKAENDRTEKLNAETKELNAQRELSGVEAGQTTESKEETSKEYADKIMGEKPND